MRRALLVLPFVAAALGAVGALAWLSRALDAIDRAEAKADWE